MTIGVVDTLTDGQIVREFEENGAGDVVIAHGEANMDGQDDPRALTEAMAQAVAPENGVGLAMVGPYEGGATFMAVYGSDTRSRTCIESRRFQDSDHIRRWLVIQGLDLVRRAVLGKLASPAD